MSLQKIVVGAAAVALGLAFMPQLASAQLGLFSNSNSAFSYPAGGCSDCSGGGVSFWGSQQRAWGKEQISSRWKASQAHNEKVYARNEAWPKPFTCAARQHYHNIWIPMYDAGWEEQCILTSIHFDENGELTRYGKQQIGGMMMNMPKARRVIFVQGTGNPAETETRMAKVRTVIETWYPQRGGIVQASGRTPQIQTGSKIIDIFDKAQLQAPAPVIPISDGSGSISSAIQN